MKTTFILTTAGSIAGVVAAVKNITLGENIAVRKAEDLEVLSLGTLTTIYNTATGKSVGKFGIAKAAAAEKTFAALEAMDVTKLIQLDADEKTKVIKAAKEATVPGERKVRDSKLQRMAACFNETDDAGKPKVWTIKSLMERCGTTDKITHQYISILRAPNDRFVLNIIKDKEAKTFSLQPKAPKGKPAANQASQQAAA